MIILEGFELHHTQPSIVSITQATETGEVYTLDQIRNISEIAHKKIKSAMDGARFAMRLFH